MSQRIPFPDALAAADALTFASRAARLSDGAVRLRADGGVLAMSAAALAPTSLLDGTPTVIGMRMLPVDPELVCDLTVDGSSLVIGDQTDLVLPETAMTAPWAGIAPPRGGWEPAGGLGADVLAARAQWGITAVAEGLPAQPGEEIVHTVRAAVWGIADDELAGLPRGVAFAAHVLGFIGGSETAQVYTSGPWTRVSLRRGHVLTRTRVHTGLTGVRTTGG